jgi:lipoprotein NlpD
MKRIFLIYILIVFFAGCANNPPAPVVNRSPQNNPSTASTNTQAQTPANGNDWRPDSYTVKKGDTLYSIGLNHGYDYREIAAANNIYEPYTIEIGQQISFASLKRKDTRSEEAPTTYENENGVIISPIDTDSGITSTSDSTVAASAVTPILASPKATREPYSLEAFNRKDPVSQPTTVVTLPTTATPTVADTVKATETEPVKTTDNTAVSSSGWSWPTQGKVIAGFNEATNKGLDIAGKKGQAITASSAGKVIYAGSDLRGYGKLVIIKHNQTFLSVYAHNSEIMVKEGQTVNAGQKIAAMGDTDTNSVKLHFEIRERGKSVDPAKYLP